MEACGTAVAAAARYGLPCCELFRPLHPTYRAPPHCSLQLAHLVVDFMQQPGMDPDVEQRFKVFLAERATK